MCRNSSMMDFDFLSTSSSDRAGLSGVWTGSDFTVGVKTTVKTLSLWKSDQSRPLDIIYIYILFSCTVCVPHQTPWLCCAPAPFCPRWHSFFGARLPLAPGLFAAHLPFDSPAAPWNCLPWWTVRAVTTEGRRSAASRCAPSLKCYDWWGGKSNKQISQSGWYCIRETNYKKHKDPLPSQSSPGVKVWVLRRSGGGLRWWRRLQRQVTIEASCPW